MTLRRAVEAGDLQTVEEMTVTRPPLDQELAIAAAGGRTEILRLLLDRGARATGLAGAEALFVSLDRDQAGSAAVLRQAGASLDAADDSGLTIAHLAASRGKTADLRRMLVFGADPEVATRTGETPLMSAADNGRPRAAELLLRAGATVDARDRDGWTALLRAVRRRELEIVSQLLAAGADPSAASELGWSALHLACRSGDAELSRILLAAGADPGTVSIAAATPLIQAVRAGSAATVAALLAAGAEVTASAGGVDAGWWARRLEDTEIQTLLAASGR